LEAVLETAVQKGADLVLIQELRGETENLTAQGRTLASDLLEGRRARRPSAGWQSTGSLSAR